jgi:hypothetical protein
MKEELETEFKVGDIVWRKNHVTNKAIQTTVESISVKEFEDGSIGVLYLTEDITPIVQVMGKPKSSGCLFSSKEECDSYPPYRPVETKNL